MITQKEIDVEVWELVDTTKNLYISNKEDIEMKEYEIKIRLTETEAEQLIKGCSTARSEGFRAAGIHLYMI